MSYKPQHSARSENRSVQLPLTVAAVLAAAGASGNVAHGRAASSPSSSANGSTSAHALLAQRAQGIEQAAMVSSSRTARRAALARATVSTSPFGYIDPNRTPSVDKRLVTIGGYESRTTAQLKARLGEAVKHMTATKAAYEQARGAAATAARALSAADSATLTKQATARSARSMTTQERDAAEARRVEAAAADAHRESIDGVTRLVKKVQKAEAVDAAALRQREDAAIAAGSLIRLGDGSVAKSVPLGTPIPGNGHVLTPQVRDWIRDALTILYASGMPKTDNDLMQLATIIYNESGGVPSVQNDWDSNAAMGIPSFGLMQTIGPTFRAFALPGHTDTANPVNQIIAGARYAHATYGSLGNVPGVRSLANGGRYLPY